MKLISIDVGIKNLAVCLFEKPSSCDCHSSALNKFKIKKWDVLDIANECCAAKCTFNDGKKPCINNAKYKKGNITLCHKHAKKDTTYLIPNNTQKLVYLNKQKIQTLHSIAMEYELKYEKKLKKVELVALIHEHIQSHYFDFIELTRANEVHALDLAINLKNKLDKFIAEEGPRIDYVIIENQIGPLAARMKSLQGMIVQYFAMCGLEVKHLSFISAANKLNDVPQSGKLSYSDRKKEGIKKCTSILTNQLEYSSNLDFFMKHKKRDDLADCFLQGLWYIDSHHLQ
jgi:hypothetical protein